jgi:hypothetical protein
VDGTYGQFIGAVTSGLVSGDTATLIHLDKNSDYRSNIGVCEVGGGTVEVVCSLLDSAANQLGDDVSLSLAPYEVRQINDIYAAAGAADTDNTRVDCMLTAGDGEFTVYASVIDNLSGDAIYIPASGH